MVIPLLANQDLTPMLSQHYWQESFDGDSLVSQSRSDAYATHLVGTPPSIGASLRHFRPMLYQWLYFSLACFSSDHILLIYI